MCVLLPAHCIKAIMEYSCLKAPPNMTFPVYRVRLSGSDDYWQETVMEFAAYGQIDAEERMKNWKGNRVYGRPISVPELNPSIRAMKLGYCNML